MSDATLNPLPQGTLPEGVERKGPEVKTNGLHANLLALLGKLGLVSLHLLNMPVVVTSGIDGVHAPSSKHGVGKAVDVRVLDKVPEDRPVFLLCILCLAREFSCNVFDESNLPGGAHIHIETAD